MRNPFFVQIIFQSIYNLLFGIAAASIKIIDDNFLIINFHVKKQVRGRIQSIYTLPQLPFKKEWIGVAWFFCDTVWNLLIFRWIFYDFGMTFNFWVWEPQCSIIEFECMYVQLILTSWIHKTSFRFNKN